MSQPMSPSTTDDTHLEVHSTISDPSPAQPHTPQHKPTVDPHNINTPAIPADLSTPAQPTPTHQSDSNNLDHVQKPVKAVVEYQPQLYIPCRPHNDASFATFVDHDLLYIVTKHSFLLVSTLYELSIKESHRKRTTHVKQPRIYVLTAEMVPRTDLLYKPAPNQAVGGNLQPGQHAAGVQGSQVKPASSKEQWKNWLGFSTSSSAAAAQPQAKSAGATAPAPPPAGTSRGKPTVTTTLEPARVQVESPTNASSPASIQSPSQLVPENDAESIDNKDKNLEVTPNKYHFFIPSVSIRVYSSFPSNVVQWKAPLETIKISPPAFIMKPHHISQQHILLTKTMQNGIEVNDDASQYNNTLESVIWEEQLTPPAPTSTVPLVPISAPGEQKSFYAFQLPFMTPTTKGVDIHSLSPPPVAVGTPQTASAPQKTIPSPLFQPDTKINTDLPATIDLLTNQAKSDVSRESRQVHSTVQDAPERPDLSESHHDDVSVTPKKNCDASFSAPLNDFFDADQHAQETSMISSTVSHPLSPSVSLVGPSSETHPVAPETPAKTTPEPPSADSTPAHKPLNPTTLSLDPKLVNLLSDNLQTSPTPSDSTITVTDNTIHITENAITNTPNHPATTKSSQGDFFSNTFGALAKSMANPTANTKSSSSTSSTQPMGNPMQQQRFLSSTDQSVCRIWVGALNYICDNINDHLCAYNVAARARKKGETNFTYPQPLNFLAFPVPNEPLLNIYQFPPEPLPVIGSPSITVDNAENKEVKEIIDAQDVEKRANEGSPKESGFSEAVVTQVDDADDERARLHLPIMLYNNFGAAVKMNAYVDYSQLFSNSVTTQRTNSGETIYVTSDLINFERFLNETQNQLKLAAPVMKPVPAPPLPPPVEKKKDITPELKDSEPTSTNRDVQQKKAADSGGADWLKSWFVPVKKNKSTTTVSEDTPHVEDDSNDKDNSIEDSRTTTAVQNEGETSIDASEGGIQQAEPFALIYPTQVDTMKRQTPLPHYLGLEKLKTTPSFQHHPPPFPMYLMKEITLNDCSLKEFFYLCLDNTAPCSMSAFHISLPEQFFQVKTSEWSLASSSSLGVVVESIPGQKYSPTPYTPFPPQSNREDPINLPNKLQSAVGVVIPPINLALTSTGGTPGIVTFATPAGINNAETLLKSQNLTATDTPQAILAACKDNGYSGLWNHYLFRTVTMKSRVSTPTGIVETRLFKTQRLAVYYAKTDSGTTEVVGLELESCASTPDVKFGDSFVVIDTMLCLSGKIKQSSSSQSYADHPQTILITKSNVKFIQTSWAMKAFTGIINSRAKSDNAAVVQSYYDFLEANIPKAKAVAPIIEQISSQCVWPPVCYQYHTGKATVKTGAAAISSITAGESSQAVEMLEEQEEEEEESEEQKAAAVLSDTLKLVALPSQYHPALAIPVCLVLMAIFSLIFGGAFASNIGVGAMVTVAILLLCDMRKDIITLQRDQREIIKLLKKLKQQK